MKSKSLLWTLVVLCIPLLSRGQSDPSVRISIDFEQGLLTELIESLESDYSLQFYYAPEWLDSLLVSIQAQDMLLDPFLDQLLTDTDLKLFREGNRIILTKGSGIYPMVASPIPTQRQQDSIEAPESDLFAREAEGPEEEILFSLETQLFEIGEKTQSQSNSKVRLYGYLKDINTGQALAGASVFKENPVVGAITDEFGYYVLSLPPGTYEVQYRFAGR
ncbi:MAG: carboxypeptidase regulatory-like domain-containing protein, partial [Bacteroidota bacterium]